MRLTYILLYLLFFSLAILLFFPSLQGEFIMDDWGYITQNLKVTQSSSPWIFWSTLRQADFWPLSYTAYWLFYRAFGENPLGYHLINVALHALNAVLLFVLAQRWRAKWPLWVALLFLLHPLHVQAVAWIIQFKTLLSTALALACLIWYPRSYVLAVCAFTLALLAKTSVLFLPLVLIFLEKPRWKALPFFALSGVAGFITLKVNELNFFDRQAYVFEMPWSEKPLMMLQNLFFYLESFLWPTRLAYMYPLQVPNWGEAWPLIVPTVLLLSFLFLLFWRKVDGREMFLAYLILLFPALGFIAIPNMKLSLVADHWTYWPNVFLILFLGTVLRFRSRVLLMLPLIPLAFFTFKHAQTFASEEAFWLQARDLNPTSAVPYYNLGTVYGKQTRTTESIEQYRRAVQFDPSHSRAWFNLGRGYFLGRAHEKAEECFLRAIALNPQLVTGYVALAKVYERVGSKEDALKILRQGLAANPGNAELAARISEY